MEVGGGGGEEVGGKVAGVWVWVWTWLPGGVKWVGGRVGVLVCDGVEVGVAVRVSMWECGCALWWRCGGEVAWWCACVEAWRCGSGVVWRCGGVVVCA